MKRVELDNKKRIELDNKKILLIILIVGVLLRAIVYFFLGPFNNDDHFSVVKFIYDNGVVPVSSLTYQAYHPPVYYFIAAQFLNFGGAKVVQLFSLICSILSFGVIYYLIKNTNIISAPKLKQYCLAFAAFMPQFIMFSLYISNDTLTALIGVLLTLQFYFFIKNPDKYRLLVLAVLLGAGLSTKLSMAYFIPSIVLLIVFVKFRQGLPLRKIVLVLVIFFITASLLGSYKLAQNYTTVGDPFYVPELMLSSFEGTQKIVPGLNNLLNINVIDLVKFPLISDASKNSFFLMMYGTFWFQHIPESNFNAANIPGYGTNELDSSLTGRMLFLVAIIPTIIMILGFLVIVHLSRKLLSDKKLKKEEFDNLLFKLVTVLLLPVCLLMFLFMGLKYDVWSLFQGRYLFLAMFGILIIISEGIELFKKYKFISKVIWVLFFSLLVLFLYYFLTNILAFLV